jgi:transposase
VEDVENLILLVETDQDLILAFKAIERINADKETRRSLILLIIKQLYVLKNADAAVMLFNQKVS